MDLSQERKNEILGILLIVLAIILGIGLFSNLAGVVGTGLKFILMTLTGKGAYLCPFLLGIWGVLVINSKTLKMSPHLVGLIILTCTALAFIHVIEVPTGQEFPAVLERQGGGFLGSLFAFFFRKFFGPAGTYVFIIAFTVIGFLLLFDILLVALLSTLKAKIQAILTRIKTRFTEFKKVFYRTPKMQKNPKISSLPEVEDDLPFLNEMSVLRQPITQSASSQELIEEVAKPIPAKPLTTSNNVQVQHRKSGLYQIPPLKLLTPAPQGNKNKTETLDRSLLLEQTLQNFGIQAKVVSVSYGPTITRYELQPAPGVKVSRIVNLADDIALAMAAADVRIVAPIPGKAAVGVEIPNQDSFMVKMRDILDTDFFQKSKSKLTLALGVDIGGEPVVADLVSMPHLLVAGATGSGKSVCINTIILSILYRARPDEVKIMLVDPKKVELAVYRDMPHLMAPVVTDPKKASAVLKMVVQEMENRYELFASAGARGIEGYNQMMLKRQEAWKKAQSEGIEVEGSLTDFQTLPFIVVIIDELADLMMVAANDVEDSICRLAQMARAAGIHLIIATQRPSVDVITGLIKANIPSRIAFAVSSQVDSRTIIDMAGAEKLLGKGDMLFSPVGAGKMRRVQGAFVSTEEVQQVVEFVKKQAQPEYSGAIQKLESGEMVIKEDEERDELYEEAIRLVVASSPSISTLQRRLHIGYARAARLIDMMEQDGIVGPYAGSKPRELLITESEIDTFLKK